ncbi:MAG: hypothetical protein ABEK17_04480 [Candidatus Aenigmatarchaeota archaeon]
MLGSQINTLMELLPSTIVNLNTETIIFFAFFIITIYSVYRLLKLAFKGLLVAVAAGIFPVIANVFLGYNFPITVETITSFAMMGVFFFIIAIIVEKILWVFKIITWPFRKLFSKNEEEELDEEIREELEKMEKENND